MIYALFTGIVFILTGLGFFAWAARVRRWEVAEAKTNEAFRKARTLGMGTPQVGIFNMVAFGAIALGSLLFCLGYFSEVYMQRADISGPIAPSVLPPAD